VIDDNDDAMIHHARIVPAMIFRSCLSKWRSIVASSEITGRYREQRLPSEIITGIKGAWDHGLSRDSRAFTEGEIIKRLVSIAARGFGRTASRHARTPQRK